MKRRPVRPSLKPIQRSGPIRRRGRSAFPKRRDPAYCAWIRTLPCIVAGMLSGFIGRHHCTGRIECAHVKTRGSGGDDVGNTVPLCSGAHRGADWSIHRGGIKSFQEQFNLNLAEIARGLATQYQEEE